MAQLQTLGFREADAQQALAASRPNGGGYSANTYQRDLLAALDWLCMHLPEDVLPAKYAAGERLVSFVRSPSGLPTCPFGFSPCSACTMFFAGSWQVNCC